MGVLSYKKGLKVAFPSIPKRVFRKEQITPQDGLGLYPFSGLLRKQTDHNVCPHLFSSIKIVSSCLPLSVNEYSTRGGTSG